MTEQRLPAVVEELQAALADLQQTNAALYSAISYEASKPIREHLDQAMRKIAGKVGAITALADMLRNESSDREIVRIAGRLAPEKKEEEEAG